jgi:hypothetical protein
MIRAKVNDKYEDEDKYKYKDVAYLAGMTDKGIREQFLRSKAGRELWVSVG